MKVATDAGRQRRSLVTALAAALLVTAGVVVAPPPASAALPPVEVTEVVLGGETVTVPMTATASRFNYTRPDLRTYQGSWDSDGYVNSFEITREVAGVGPVTLEVSAGSVVYVPNYGIYVAGQFANVDATGSLTVTQPLSMDVSVREVTYGGSTAEVYCTFRNSDVVTSGQVFADGLAFRIDSTLAAPISACGGHASVIQAALAGPASVELWFPGAHPVAAEEVVSEMVVTPSSAGGTVHDRVAVDVAVTWAPDGVAIGAPGSVQLVRDGTQVSTARLGADGTARFYVDLTTAGLAEYEVVYGGRAVGDVGFPLPSSVPLVFDVEPFPTGRAVSGAIVVNDVVSPVPAGAVWVGGDYDPVSGALGPGALASPVGSVTIPGALMGSIDLVVQQRLVQVGEVGGQVRPDGTVELDPVQFQIDARSASYGGDLQGCVGEPFTVELVGTADVGGLHLTAEDLTLGAAPPGSCAGQANNINDMLGGTVVDLELHVAGDFTPPDAIQTEVAVRSYYGVVDQYNQTILLARVEAAGAGAVTGGVVTFADGGQVLATVPVSAGAANAVVELPFAGARNITASYSGSGRFTGSASSAPVMVTSAPTGQVPVGGLTIAGWPVAPGAAGVLIGSLAPGGSTSWMPMVLSGEVGGVASTAEVRLIQVGTFTKDATGLDATFALQVRSVSAAGATVVPLGCFTLMTVELEADGNGGFTVSSGSSVSYAADWCRYVPLASAWTDALVGPVSGSLSPPA